MQVWNIDPDALKTGYDLAPGLSMGFAIASNATTPEMKIAAFMTLSMLLSQHALICCCGAKFRDDGGPPLTDGA